MGLDSYFLFLCILTGMATTIHQIVVASDNQVKGTIKPCRTTKLVSWWHIHCWQWVCQNYQCQDAQKAWSTEVCHTHFSWKPPCCLSTLLNIRWQNGAMCDLSPALVLSLISCCCGCHVQNVDLSNHRRPGSVVQCCLCLESWVSRSSLWDCFSTH